MLPMIKKKKNSSTVFYCQQKKVQTSQHYSLVTSPCSPTQQPLIWAAVLEHLSPSHPGPSVILQIHGDLYVCVFAHALLSAWESHLPLLYLETSSGLRSSVTFFYLAFSNSQSDLLTLFPAQSQYFGYFIYPPIHLFHPSVHLL